MLSVVGIVHAQGEYNGQKYDNYNLHCTRPANEQNDNEQGCITEIIKVKATLFSDCDVNIGDNIDVAYDKYGRIKEIVVC